MWQWPSLVSHRREAPVGQLTLTLAVSVSWRSVDVTLPTHELTGDDARTSLRQPQEPRQWPQYLEGHLEHKEDNYEEDDEEQSAPSAANQGEDVFVASANDEVLSAATGDLDRRACLELLVSELGVRSSRKSQCGSSKRRRYYARRPRAMCSSSSARSCPMQVRAKELPTARCQASSRARTPWTFGV